MILVTGAKGFIGPKVVHALRARNLAVRALVREPRRAAQLAGWGVELVQGDMTDEASLREAVRGVEHVIKKMDGTIHLAVGNSYTSTGGTNVSRIHWDIVKDLRRGGRLYADGALVQEDGDWRL